MFFWLIEVEEIIEVTKVFEVVEVFEAAEVPEENFNSQELHIIGD